ncbi:hypothetical protein G9U53_25810 [Rhodococcus sp. D-46]|uniref:hypothetical protein n=1 Tax=Rhodococcus TaxID=1827 RepID=UPI0013F5F797|nr:hypothetical protein [Rhodococcus qingshengii]MBS3694041.1 hypothetical protein [Rhodococcus qingshengii]NHE67729.1 hypothetical protein [Rhodococcus sp. D-46]
MSLTRTKKIAATTAAASLAAGGILLATAPAATAAPAPRPGNVPASYGAPVVNIPINHALTVAAHQSGIVAALSNANVTIPVPGWTGVIDATAEVLKNQTARAAQYPNGCTSYQFYLPPGGTWAVNAASYANCPW